MTKTRAEWVEAVINSACQYFTSLQIIKSRGNASQVEQHVLHDQNKALRSLLLEVPDPAGWKLVPVIADKNMSASGNRVLDGSFPFCANEVYEEMIAASPEYKGKQ